ncbi:Type I Iterative PKS [Myotisia sp. PD_48]|nr:Type I Iterative PKS [Myotisia sp. PD_48]
MAGNLSSLSRGSTVLLFGPQALTFDEQSFNRLKSSLLDTPDNRWILDVIFELPEFWKLAARLIPVLGSIDGEGLLNHWIDSFKQAQISQKIIPLPNIILTPLVVIIHLTQYLKCWDCIHASMDDVQTPEITSSAKCKSLGFCTGVLSATAISISTTKTQLQMNGAVAIRLAMLIGALVDAHDVGQHGDSKSLSVTWPSADSHATMLEILEQFPEAYISVLFDEKRVTITTSKSTIARLIENMRMAGLTAAEVNLHGRFHHENYLDSTNLMIQLCDQNSSLQFVVDSEPGSLSEGGEVSGLAHKDLHSVALRSILVDQCNWYRTFTSTYDTHLTEDGSRIFHFGHDVCIPPSLMRKLGSKLIQAGNLDVRTPSVSSNLYSSDAGSNHSIDLSEDGIAIVGLSCKVAGAEDLDHFWDLLCAGNSQHSEPPNDRFNFQTYWRDLDPKRKWYGNFVSDHDVFDHKFFKKSPREMASTDPQQRWVLQIAYQALEQSGYFCSADPDRHIGCYIGAGCVDYEQNIACYPPNAYSATGNLKSFIAGKVSHFFGWTGPSLTIDTACSSSAVAVHQACRAILTGECSAAIAGGVTIMTSPLWFQNLAGASFLSPTGNCRPFDADADGYCRGEGIAAVFLKKVSSAIANGDQIFGVISATAVYQNQNCTPITVPNANSLADLFKEVTRKARLEPKQVTVVEAHGTGTPVGDPAEYEGILRAFGDPTRPEPLSLGSVKGLIGHTETAAGIVSLVKIVLMIHEAAIPPQASFNTISPLIKANPADNIAIPTKLNPWDAEFRAALINNYGASGSNASLVVTQPPNKAKSPGGLFPESKHPIRICGNDDNSLRRYSTRFRRYLQSKISPSKNLNLSNLAFNLCRQSNPNLSRQLIFCCDSVASLEENLTKFEHNDKDYLPISLIEPKPVILCFGGQVSTYIGLDSQIYENCNIFRNYLDKCNLVGKSLDIDSIYPEIFQKQAIADVVKLQFMLFSMQYSCAMTWIDCGVAPVALVGHSFGELTALCVSGILSLVDSIKLIKDRALSISSLWGDDRGSMMVVESDLQEVQRLLYESKSRYVGDGMASVACYNGPKSFTLAGPTGSIEAVEATLVQNSKFSSMRTKKLKVTNAFHSTLVEPLMERLEQVGRGLHFGQAKIHLERCTEFETSLDDLGSNFVADHMRSPVYFNQAVQRISKLHPCCVWLEAGSNSTVATMAGRALNFPAGSHFQGLNITSDNGLNGLTDATINLWKQGLHLTFWPHHQSQAPNYTPMLLPPYQFDTSRHWVDLKTTQNPNRNISSGSSDQITSSTRLWSFVAYKDSKQRLARFSINTGSQEFQKYVSGHIIAHAAPLCPSTFQFDIAIEALLSLRPEYLQSNIQPQLRGLENHSPIGLNSNQQIWLDVECLDAKFYDWEFKMMSDAKNNTQNSKLYVSGRIIFKSADDINFQNHFARYERLSGHDQCLSLLDGDEVDDIIQGRNIYKTFGEVVDYGEVYRGVKKLVGKGNKSAGRIVKKYTGETWLDTPLADSFCQCAGIFVNCMTDISEKDMYISNKIEQWIRSPKILPCDSRPEVWEVLAFHHRPAEKEISSDVFVFDSRNGALVETILGIGYKKVPKAALGDMLSRLTTGSKTNEAIILQSTIKPEGLNSEPYITPKPTNSQAIQKSSQQDVTGDVKSLLSTVTGIEIDEIKNDTSLDAIGIDSLMGMELAREIESTFNCSLDMEALNDVTDFKSLLSCIQRALGNDDLSPLPTEALHQVDKEISGAQNSCNIQVNGTRAHDNSAGMECSNAVAKNTLTIPADIILEAFGESKQLTDNFILENKFADYYHDVLPKQTELCIAYIVEAFEKLGSSIRATKPGQPLLRIKHIPKHKKFVNYLYMMLEKAARIIDIDGSGGMTRTVVSPPAKSADTLLQDLINNYPDHSNDHKLTHLVGSKLAECLSGEADGVQLIFGSPQGRELVSGLYGGSPINMTWLKQMEDILNRIASKLPIDEGPLKILEMGAGTGGATAILAPLLASLSIPVEYTFTDISPSLVAAARKRFNSNPIMQFRVLDIEKTPPPDLLHGQHIVIATNCVHATHNLQQSTQKIHQVLRPDGFLMILEMTDTLYWVDIIFGVLEGWWLYDDGRQHVVAHETFWEKSMRSAGYSHVDWTEGNRPEANLQRLIIAMASGSRYERVPHLSLPTQCLATNYTARQIILDELVQKYTRKFAILGRSTNTDASPKLTSHCVLVTGATGSLGSHLVSHLASISNVNIVICLNRRGSQDPVLRQHRSLESRGISLNQTALSKLNVFAAQSDKPFLGLQATDYQYLVKNVTCIVHNAWPMSIKRPLTGFEPQFQTMQNLLNLAADISSSRPQGFKVRFQFISSIAVVGFYPLVYHQPNVPEKRVSAESVLESGYADAKLVCEKMLDETLHQYPDRFASMVVRIGQIAGSKTSGYWNPVEHFSFLIKSSQTLKLLPKLEGDLSWCPVDDVAATLSDLLISDFTPYPIYHIENPARQGWQEMISILATLLDIQGNCIIPFSAWLNTVRQFPGSTELDNPAKKMIDFFEHHFRRMSCGGLIMETTRSREHSTTLATMKPISANLVKKYIMAWKYSQFLSG